MTYANDFERFYSEDYRHTDIPAFELHLDHYPYSAPLPLPEDGAWLEVGCGSGRVVAFHQGLGGANRKIVCIDASQKALSLCRTNLPQNVELHCVNILRTSLMDVFEPQSFNLITLFGTLQAFDKEDRLPFAASLMPLLRPGGTLVFSLHPFSLLECIRCLPAPRYYKNMTSRRELGERLDRLGLSGRWSISYGFEYVLINKILLFFGMKGWHWHGFLEMKDTQTLRCIYSLARRFARQLVLSELLVSIRQTS